VQNKVFFLSRPTPVFLPKRSKKGLFFCQYVFTGAAQTRLGVEGECFATDSEIAIFEQKKEVLLKETKETKRRDMAKYAGIG